MTEHTYWNDNGQLVSSQYDDIYFSTDNGLQESRYVFLQQNQLDARFLALANNSTFTIAETGFGTGLNFLATCQLWQANASENQHLHFISVEKFPLNKATIQQALLEWPELDFFTQQLLQHYPAFTPMTGFHRLSLPNNITLTLIIDDAAVGFKQLIASPIHTLAPIENSTEANTEAFSNNNDNSNSIVDDIFDERQQQRQWSGVDAWFLDGFAPAKNPDMWTDELFSLLLRLSKKTTTLATFTAAGIVRRGLLQAGFTVKKVTGFGRKREMLVATIASVENIVHSEKETPIGVVDKKDSEQNKNKSNKSSKNSSPRYQKTHPIFTSSPWPIIKHYQPTPLSESVAVIGGGIAGCHTAYALAKKGYQVTLFEQGYSLAVGASGNAQGVIYAKLAAQEQTLGNMNLHSLLYAQQFYQDYWQQSAANKSSEEHQESHGQQCGVLQLGLTEKLQKEQQKIAQRFALYEEHVRYVSAEKASAIANTRIDYPALYFPQSGWIDLQALCQWLCRHPNINVVPHTQVTTLESENDQNGQQDGHQWVLHTHSKSSSQIPTAAHQQHRFHTVVVSNAYDALAFEQTQHLPLKSIRGQVTHLPANKVSSALSTAVCGKGYIAPAQVSHCLGATYDLSSQDTTLSHADHKQNLEQTAQQVPEIIQSQTFANDATDDGDIAQLEGRVGFRCTTPDYLPIVGAAPQADQFIRDYAPLKKDRRLIVPHAGQYHRNLYLNVGHGSRGLTYTPLSSEILASLIAGCPPPTHQAMGQALSPARFIIRQLIKQQ